MPQDFKDHFTTIAILSDLLNQIKDMLYCVGLEKMKLISILNLLVDI